MYISSVVCESTLYLRLFFWVKLFRSLLFIVLPIGLIMTLSFRFLKKIITEDEEKRKELNIFLKKIGLTCILFILPLLVNIFLSIISPETKQNYEECMINATTEKIEYYGKIEVQVDEIKELIYQLKMKPTKENLLLAEDAVSKLYGVANGTIIEDLEFQLADFRNKTLDTTEEFECKSKGGVFISSECHLRKNIPTNDLLNEYGMVYYTYKTTNDYIVINSKVSVLDYVNHVKNKRICQKQDTFTYNDQCLCFAEEYAHALMSGDISKDASSVNKHYYKTFKTFTSDEIKDILKFIYSELISNRPVILHVNGKSDGTSRHYVTAIGFKSNVTSADLLTENDILFLDSYNCEVRELHTWGTPKFLTTGAKCHKKDYTGYQLYIWK